MDKKDEKFKEAFQEASSLTGSEIANMLSYGSGPKIQIKNLDTDSKEKNGGTSSFHIEGQSEKHYNSNKGEGLIILDDDVVNMMEKAVTNGDREIGKLMVESTLFHESTHYGNIKNRIHKESGKFFEKKVYGQDLDRRNVKSYWQSLQPQLIQPITIRNIP
jgi:hypothetical protein